MGNCDPLPCLTDINIISIVTVPCEHSHVFKAPDPAVNIIKIASYNIVHFIMSSHSVAGVATIYCNAEVDQNMCSL